jgi:hypothetical protein
MEHNAATSRNAVLSAATFHYQSHYNRYSCITSGRARKIPTTALPLQAIQIGHEAGTSERQCDALVSSLTLVSEQTQ